MVVIASVVAVVPLINSFVSTEENQSISPIRETYMRFLGIIKLLFKLSRTQLGSRENWLTDQ